MANADELDVNLDEACLDLPVPATLDEILDVSLEPRHHALCGLKEADELLKAALISDGNLYGFCLAS